MRKTIATLVILFSSALIFAQEVLNIHSVLEMNKAGLSDAVMSKKISNSESDFNLSTDILILLKQQGVSDTIIKQMISKQETKNKIKELPTILTSIQNKENALLLNETYNLKKGDSVQIYLPVNKDFLFVKKKKGLLGKKLIGDIAGIVGTGAAAVGLGTGNIKVMSEALNVMSKAAAVQYGVDALNRIDDLDISKKSKKIAGKKAKVLGWNFTEDGYIIDVKLGKKKYEIYLQEALMVGEVKLL